MSRNLPVPFETGLATLEQLALRLEGEMPLETAFEAYSEAMTLYKTLLAQLDDTEKRMHLLENAVERACE